MYACILFCFLISFPWGNSVKCPLAIYEHAVHSPICFLVSASCLPSKSMFPLEWFLICKYLYLCFFNIFLMFYGPCLSLILAFGSPSSGPMSSCVLKFQKTAVVVDNFGLRIKTTNHCTRI